MRLLPISQAANLLAVKPRTIYDRRWRQRAGLPLTRIGRRVGVLEKDIEAILKKGRERLG